MFKQTLPQLKALNFWTLKQKIKDHTIQRTPTIQLLQKIDIYHLNDVDRAKLASMTDGQKQLAFLKEHGELERSTGEVKSHSFVIAFNQLIALLMAHPFGLVPDYITITDTGNAARTASSSGWSASNSSVDPGNTINIFAAEAPATNTNYGILVGTGVTAPATTDYAMETLVAHGSSAGTLQYQATSVGDAGVVGANVDVVLARVLVNGSGGSITLREIGLVISTVFDLSSTTPRYFLVAHDAVNQAIANTEIAVVGYIIRTTV